MAQIRIPVVEDVCLGYRVYRGSVMACELEPAIWIDFYDDVVNPKGYFKSFPKNKRGIGFPITPPISIGI